MTTWFSADHHFFHDNIIHKIKLRTQFSGLKRMHSYMIEKHNTYVKPEDTCYFVGDIAMLRKDKIMKLHPILDQLNGNKHLVLGNHDEGKPFTYVKMGFDSVHTALILPEDNKFVLAHDPANSVVDRSKAWIVGHVHKLFTRVGNCINVGVDVWDFEPVSLDLVKEMTQNVT